MSLRTRFTLLRATVAGAFASLAHVFGAPSAAEPIRVMAYNIRTSTAPDAENAWPLRRDFFFQSIAAFRPDLIGFQEVREDQRDQIEAQLPEFAFSGVARDDGKRQGEWSLIAVRKARFDVLRHGDFWLSEQPEVPGSKSWDAALTRLCSWARLRDRSTGRELVFANTHFDHKGVLARRHSARLLSERLTTIASSGPAILVGDFNLTEDDPGYAVLVRPENAGAVRWIDTYRALHPQRMPDEATFHGFKGGSTGSRIDFIFHTQHFSTLESGIDRSVSPAGRYPSDHYAVTAVIHAR